MSKDEAARAASASARAAIAPCDKATFAGEEFTIYPPGTIELCEFIGEHPAFAPFFDGAATLQSKVAAGAKSVLQLARMCCRDGADREDFDKLVRRASFSETMAFIRKVVALTAGEDGIGPFVERELAPAMLVITGREKAELVAGFAKAIADMISVQLEIAFAGQAERFKATAAGLRPSSGKVSSPESSNSKPQESPAQAA